ncbi:hypothetical protein EW145_g3771 [Phellinidium pouzarii]|uniref:HAD-like protein n=1 Tax=Phellinidium pouzarii TaxID=167371 RepID=A0A4S4L653_9AGAM|nr:hypothetical protein EW145_g3771 [Phellinidium pouzarii]
MDTRQRTFSSLESLSSCNILIVDIGDVLLSWSLGQNSVSPKIIKEMRSSSLWNDFERGRISQQKCYEMLGSRFDILATDIARTFSEARTTVRIETQLFHYIRALKDKQGLAVYAMSNISREDYNYIRALNIDWDVFDGIFTSFSAGLRKPDLSFFHKVISETGINPPKAVFVDDKLDNVIVAQSTGMRGIVFHDPNQIIRAITNLVCDPVERARRFLRQNVGLHHSVTSTGVIIHENFAQYLILDLTGDKSLIKVWEKRDFLNFFKEKAQMTTETFPADLDTTAIRWSTEKNVSLTDLDFIMDEMLQYCNDDGIIQVYFDHERVRVDPIVCVNVLAFFYMHGRGEELRSTLAWVVSVLTTRAFLDGTRYYKSADAFLYFFSRLLSFGDTTRRLYRKYASLLSERLRERIGSQGDSLELGMRILACASVHIIDTLDTERLRERQNLDGSWEDGWIYRFVQTGIYIGNKGLTTAFAMRAIETASLYRGKPILIPPS